LTDIEREGICVAKGFTRSIFAIGKRIDRTSEVPHSTGIHISLPETPLMMIDTGILDRELNISEEEIKAAVSDVKYRNSNPSNLVLRLSDLGLNTTPKQRRDEVIRHILYHEWAHGRYAGDERLKDKILEMNADLFGVPEDVWSDKGHSPAFQDNVVQDVFAYLIQLAVSDQVSSDFEAMAIQRLAANIKFEGPPKSRNSHSWAARYDFSIARVPKKPRLLVESRIQLEQLQEELLLAPGIADRARILLENLGFDLDQLLTVRFMYTTDPKKAVNSAPLPQTLAFSA
jgi:hypothetical protein